MRNGKPETPAEKFGYYVLGPLVAGVVALCVLGTLGWIWYGH
ncbi:hypothetical protein SEA_RASOVI_32 [Microbacterium phage Rasovi]|nr:hypothetical protein SEA_RASOVI_32 [Microbacterium phage Rasovi]